MRDSSSNPSGAQPLTEKEIDRLRDMLQANIPAPVPVWLDTVARLLATLDAAVARAQAAELNATKETP